MSLRRSKILVIQWARLGDLFHSRPLCEAALRVFHPADIVFSCDERYAAIVESFPEVDHVLPVSLGRLTALARTDAALPDLMNEMGELIAEASADVVINLTNHRAAQTFAERIGSDKFFGYGFDDSGALNSLCKANQSQEGQKHVAHVWQSLIDPSSALHLPRSLASINPTKESGDVALICTAGSVERSLTEETIRVIAAAIGSSGEKRVTLLGTSQIPLDDSISTHVRDLRGQTTLGELRRELNVASLVIGPDTGALHYAAALGKQVLGLYLDNANPEVTGPLTKSARCLSAHTQDRDFHERLAGEIERLQHADQPDKGTDEEYARDLSIIITEYAQTHYTDALLKSLQTSPLPDNSEIIVMSSGLDAVDAGFAATREGVCADIASRTRTFAEACNRGALLSNGRWLLFLNDDCVLSDNSFRTLWETRSEGEISGPVLRNWDGLIQSAGFALEDDSVKEISRGQWKEEHEPKHIDGVSAAAMLIHRSVFNKLSGFDEAFHNGYEDVDLCLRAKRQGIGVRVVNCAVLHFQGSSPERYDRDDDNLTLLQTRWTDHMRSVAPTVQQSSTRAPLVLLSDETPESAGAVLRWRNPLKALGLAEGRDFVWLTSESCNETTISECLLSARAAIVFRSLQSTNVRRLLCEWSKCDGNVLLYDSDDLLVNRFPSHSPRATQRLEFERAVRDIAERAHVISGPNDIVVNQFGHLGGTRVVLETLPLSGHFNRQKDVTSRDTFNIGYAGSSAHQTDFAVVAPSLLELIETDSQVRFYWWGAHPGELATHPQVRRGGNWVSDYNTHIERVQRSMIDLWIVPLAESKHNSARSPIKAFEYIGAGAPCLYSNVLPYNKLLRNIAPGLLVDNNHASWLQAMRSWMTPTANAALRSQLELAKVMLLEKSAHLEFYKTLLEQFEVTKQHLPRMVSELAGVQ